MSGNVCPPLIICQGMLWSGLLMTKQNASIWVLFGTLSPGLNGTDGREPATASCSPEVEDNKALS